MKRCPNCGSAVKEGAKFCTSCGYKMPKVNNVNNRSRQAVEVDTCVMKEVSISYWGWLTSSWKHPLEVEYGGKYAGLVTLAIEGAIFALSVMILVKKVAGAFVDTVGKSTATAIGVSSTNIGFNVFIFFFLMLFLTSLVIIGILFIVDKGFSNDDKSYLDLVNEIAYKTSSLLLLNVVLLLYSTIVSHASANTTVLIGAILILASIVWTIGILSVAFELKDAKMDALYIGLIIYVFHMIIIAIAARITINHYAVIVSDMLEKFINMLSDFVQF